MKLSTYKNLYNYKLTIGDNDFKVLSATTDFVHIKEPN